MTEEIKPLDLHPGLWGLPVMRVLGLLGTEDPKFLRVRLQAERQGLAGPETVTISVPISTLDAAGLLRSLVMLRDKGLIPFVQDPPQPERPN